MTNLRPSPDTTCAICGKAGSVRIVDTYKSIWHDCAECGCYSRTQKNHYPHEATARVLRSMLGGVPKLGGFLKSLARKEQGVDFYRYYSDQLTSPDRGPWEGQSDMVTAELRREGLLDGWQGKRVLEISGEPGYFAFDLMQAGADVLVSAFADDVARAMTDHLKLKTFTYDFNADDITSKVETHGGVEPYDFIFIRFSIGFCLDVPTLMRKLSPLLKDGGLLYISFSPASRAVLLRWMFDDYTYLRQYTEEHLNTFATKAGMALQARFDEGFFHWDQGPFSLHWSLRPVARTYFKDSSYFSEASEDDKVQRRVALVYVKA
ncbi:methyltransferase domain-containing protein [Rhizobium sp. BE258]|uniref:class I SAM-dependent methyltransferase n=1 Tax=Rhizobium sp. BE258 TaxID=2817722 RepID=UPI0028561A9E|nr:methyltransferase domain-containing protein [Rhizobium sp. BE258]MDR7142204.1 hypothetical protein [Rhizobium sp. BE258]